MLKNYFKAFAVSAVATMALGSNAETLTVHDGTDSNGNVPVYCSFYDEENTMSQMIYPASDLAAVTGKDITSITFYAAGSGYGMSGGLLQVSVGETTQTTYGEAVTGLTVVKTFALEPASTLVINFDDAYHYTGGNFVVETKVISGGDYAFSYFLGESQSSNTSYNYSTSMGGSPRAFLPKMTVEYEGEAQPYAATVNPLSLDFGSLALNKYPKTMTVTVKNIGQNAFTPTISGVEAPFSIDYTSSELAGGSNVEINVTLAPEEEGEFNGTMTINCGEAGSFDVTLAGVATEAVNEALVNEGTTVNSYIPVYGLYYDAVDTKSQMIYPEDMLLSLVGKEITGVKFHTQSGVKFNNGEMELTMGITDVDAFESASEIEGADVVATAPAVKNEETLDFTLDEPMLYEGGNLLMGVKVVTAGSYSSTYFLGNSTDDYQSFYSYTSYSGLNEAPQKFLPMLTFIYNNASTVGVSDIATDRAVKSVRYYNIAGMQSSTPFNGMNIVVTEYTDGTKSSVKIIK